MTDRLDVKDLRVTYAQRGESHAAVTGVSFTVNAGEILGIVGESGSGKSSLAHAIMRLLPKTAELSGTVDLGGTNLLELTEAQMSGVRGRQIGMVFQDPSSALNPVFTISTQIVDTLRRHHKGLSRKDARRLASEAVEAMGIRAERLRSYPHELSGGMRQRALIAAAMAAEPSFLVADEPTSDLDTISQAQILELLRQLRKERGIGVILISHDIRVVASICDKVGVMLDGDLIEFGDTDDVLRSPSHAYTRNFLRVSTRQRDEHGVFATMPRRGAMQPTGTPL
jgi:ABC-type dipeptide/oligopeptide/nickel transport system ATPase component